MENYETLGVLGEGTYGVVVKAKQKSTGKLVAIKKFKQVENEEHVKKTSMREVRLLKQLKHPNIINLMEVFRRDGQLFLVFEYIERTVLESDSGALKLCDFGFARPISAKGKYTDYVATRWYRAPELLVGDVSYTKAVDVWAIGCIFAELSDTQPLFPGSSDLDQLSLILRCCGPLPSKMVRIFEANPLYKRVSFPRMNIHRTIYDRYANRPQEWLEFLAACLATDPEKRLSCTDLLNLDYFTKNNFREEYDKELQAMGMYAPPLVLQRSSKRSATKESKKSGKGEKGEKLDSKKAVGNIGSCGSKLSDDTPTSALPSNESPTAPLAMEEKPFAPNPPSSSPAGGPKDTPTPEPERSASEVQHGARKESKLELVDNSCSLLHRPSFGQRLSRVATPEEGAVEGSSNHLQSISGSAVAVPGSVSTFNTPDLASDTSPMMLASSQGFHGSATPLLPTQPADKPPSRDGEHRLHHHHHRHSGQQSSSELLQRSGHQPPSLSLPIPQTPHKNSLSNGGNAPLPLIYQMGSEVLSQIPSSPHHHLVADGPQSGDSGSSPYVSPPCSIAGTGSSGAMEKDREHHSSRRGSTRLDHRRSLKGTAFPQIGLLWRTSPGNAPLGGTSGKEDSPEVLPPLPPQLNGTVSSMPASRGGEASSSRLSNQPTVATPRELAPLNPTSPERMRRESVRSTGGSTATESNLVVNVLGGAGTSTVAPSSAVLPEHGPGAGCVEDPPAQPAIAATPVGTAPNPFPGVPALSEKSIAGGNPQRPPSLMSNIFPPSTGDGAGAEAPGNDFKFAFRVNTDAGTEKGKKEPLLAKLRREYKTILTNKVSPDESLNSILQTSGAPTANGINSQAHPPPSRSSPNPVKPNALEALSALRDHARHLNDTMGLRSQATWKLRNSSVGGNSVSGSGIFGLVTPGEDQDNQLLLSGTATFRRGIPRNINNTSEMGSTSLASTASGCPSRRQNGPRSNTHRPAPPPPPAPPKPPTSQSDISSPGRLPLPTSTSFHSGGINSSQIVSSRNPRGAAFAAGSAFLDKMQHESDRRQRGTLNEPMENGCFTLNGAKPHPRNGPSPVERKKSDVTRPTKSLPASTKRIDEIVDLV
eukprot:gene2049-1237_t